MFRIKSGFVWFFTVLLHWFFGPGPKAEPTAEQSAEAMYSTALRTFQTGKPVISNYNEKTGKFETKVLE